jgi:hypothetical protein
LARLGAASAPTLSPEGARVAFVTRLSGVPQVWVAPASSGYPRQVTAFDDPVTGVLWSPDGAWLAVGVAPGGGNNGQIYLVRPDGTGARRITPGGKDNNALNTWSRDGRTLFLASNRESPGEMRVYAYDVARGTTTPVAGTGGVGGATDGTRDGTRLTILRLKSRGNSDMWLRDTRTGREVLLTPHADRSQFGGGLFSDARTVWLRSNRDSDLLGLARVRLGPDGSPGPLELVARRDDAELDEVALSDDGTVGRSSGTWRGGASWSCSTRRAAPHAGRAGADRDRRRRDLLARWPPPGVDRVRRGSHVRCLRAGPRVRRDHARDLQSDAGGGRRRVCAPGAGALPRPRRDRALGLALPAAAPGRAGRPRRGPT